VDVVVRLTEKHRAAALPISVGSMS
jgi:hypothetical protein